MESSVALSKKVRCISNKIIGDMFHNAEPDGKQQYKNLFSLTLPTLFFEKN